MALKSKDLAYQRSPKDTDIRYFVPLDHVSFPYDFTQVHQ